MYSQKSMEMRREVYSHSIIPWLIIIQHLEVKRLQNNHVTTLEFHEPIELCNLFITTGHYVTIVRSGSKPFPLIIVWILVSLLISFVRDTLNNSAKYKRFHASNLLSLTSGDFHSNRAAASLVIVELGKTKTAALRAEDWKQILYL